MQKTIENQQNNSQTKKTSIFKKFSESMKTDYPVFILSVIAFIVIGVISFFGVTRNVTIAAFSLNEYEVGQIADRTIIADKTLPATPGYPIAIHEGEKIIKRYSQHKTFVI